MRVVLDELPEGIELGTTASVLVMDEAQTDEPLKPVAAPTALQ